MENMDDCKPEGLVVVPGSLLFEFLKSYSRRDKSSLHKYILACLLLISNEPVREVDDQTDLCVPSRDQSERKEETCVNYADKLGGVTNLEHIELKKKKAVVVKSHSASGSSGGDQRSSDCFLPGLHDDIAQDCLAWTSRSDYPSLSCLNKKFNMLLKNGYLYRLRRKYGIVEHWVYLACSLMPWQAFDPSRRTWMRLPRMPCDECFSCADKESLAVGTQLLVFGREYSGLAIWMYSLIKRDWSRCTEMNLPRCLFGSGSYGEIAIVAGGCDKNGQVLKCAELYNSESESWETLPDMHFHRRLSSGFFMDGKFYIIGGVSSEMNSLTCGEEYDLETRTWRRIPDMYPGGNSASQSPPLVAVVNQQLYAADQSMNVVKKYDKGNNTWHVVKPLPVQADYSNGWGLAFKACGERLLVIGGHRTARGEVIVLHSWRPEQEPAGGEWEVLAVKERAGVFVYNCAIMGC